jgi:hypothetical protein
MRLSWGFAVWASIQIFFISAILSIWWRLQRALRQGEDRRRAIERLEGSVSLVRNLLTVWADDWGSSPEDLKAKLRDVVEDSRRRESMVSAEGPRHG